jgi:hypothetical protein
MDEVIYGTLRIYGMLCFKPVMGNSKETRKPVLLETAHWVTCKQAENLMKDFRGQNHILSEDFYGKWVSETTVF